MLVHGVCKLHIRQSLLARTYIISSGVDEIGVLNYCINVTAFR